MVACGPMFLGWTLITYAQNSAMILAGRASCAAASAVAIPASYTYVAEIARHTFACCSFLIAEFPWNSSIEFFYLYTKAQFIYPGIIQNTPQWPPLKVGG